MFLLGLFLFLAFLLLVRFSVEFRLVTEGIQISPGIKFGIGRLLCTIPQGLLTKASQRIRKRSFSTLEATLKGANMGLRLLDSLLQKIELLQLEVRIGTGDPFWTSLGTGGLWAILGPLLTALSSGDRLRSEPEIRIQPDYGEANVRVDLHCIFHFRVGQIILNELKRVMV